ncbi:uncharacterized protein [Chelonus insularis]|uniref:uncharacterized protein n=1 Tax=Chelonus insularis TaxID=460826 RepID=UPI00158B223D|nr:uncharacterized protein LOC118070779 [Chelonus insularis]
MENTSREEQNLLRPPLIGWSSQSNTKKIITWNEQMVPNAELSSKSSNELNSQYEFKDEKNDNGKVIEPVCLMTELSDRDIKIISPTSSVASQNKPLEWDSLADVGYHNTLVSTRDKPHGIFHLTESELPIRNSNTKLSRLDPEGTTTTSPNSFIQNSTLNDSLFKFANQSLKPNAHSTKIFDDGLELKKDLKVILSNATISVKSDNDKNLSRPSFVCNKTNKLHNKLCTRKKKHKLIPISILFDENQSVVDSETLKKSNSTLKRNASMHELLMPLASVSLKKSQSELNLRETISDNCKSSLIPLNFLSSSSITTIINKPSVCDKNIQTNLNEVNKKTQKSKATQASSTMDTNPIKIKNSECFKEFSNEDNQVKNVVNKTAIAKTKASQSLLDQESNYENLEGKINGVESNESLPSESREEIDGGRASNSFEYFPGYIYQNLPYEKNTSHRYVNTERSHSTIPNTSSSLDEKLWEDSNSLLRDLERSLNILKSLINTDKYDKQVKKRLIHHVIKRLVTARYSDDKIEHNLDENVPWNPDNARNKIYCTEIIQALAKKQNQDSTEESFENWKLNRQDFLYNKTTTNQSTNFSEVINFASSEDSDAFEERTTDKTDGMQDGRKARLGLRSNDKYNHPRHYHKYKIEDHTIVDTDKSISSECFLPQSQNIQFKEKNLNKTLYSKVTRKGLVSPKLSTKTNTFLTPSFITVPSATNNISSSNTVTTATSTSTTVTIITSADTTPYTPTSTTSQSSNNKNKIQSATGHNNVDWRLPATISERRFKYEKKAQFGTISQLINYVEIEKKNQLLWINNEINHLLNLKKLLEEPTNVQKHETKKEKHCSAVSKDEIFKGQWSSHGNLAKVNMTKNTSPKKTKNNYTQTVVHDDDVPFFDDKNLNIVDEFNTHSQTNQSDSQQSIFFKTSNQPKKKRNRNYQSHVLYFPFQDIGTQTVENNLLINEDMNDQIPIITQVPINSKKETKNILNDKCKSESPITADEDQEIFHDSKNHCYGCLCHQIKKKPFKFNRNEDKVTISNMPKILCNCDIQNEKFINKSKHNQIEDNITGRKSEIIGKKKSGNKFQTCQSGARCQKCGIIYTDTSNQKCQCTYSYRKSIAYELCFESKNENKRNYESIKLKDYLNKNKPNFVDNVEMRKRCMMEISHLRQMKREKIMQLLALASPSNLLTESKILKRSEKLNKKTNKDETTTRFRSRYLLSNEKRNKRKQQEKSDQLRHNYLMAKIFCKKLQQKVLQGQVTLSQSISIISNL